jgi:thiol-disulfide isomerase/thioredoxin
MGRETNKSRRESTASAAREKAAAARAEQRRAEQRRRAFQVIGGVVVVVILVVVAVVVSLNHKSKSDTTVADASAAVVNGITSVSTATINTVGKGSSGGTLGTVNDSAFTSGGKPDFLYVGAEYCPYCAAERWSMIQALSRFGTMTGLKEIHSSEDNLPTFTFVGSTYTSKYLTFTPVELEDQNRKALQSLTAEQQAVFKKYSPSEAFPFLYFGGKAVQSGAGYNPLLLSGKTHEQVSSQLNDPSNSVTKGVVGEANALTAAICTMTGDQPSTVCSQPAVTSAKAALKPFATTS